MNLRHIRFTVRLTKDKVLRVGIIKGSKRRGKKNSSLLARDCNGLLG